MGASEPCGGAVGAGEGPYESNGNMVSDGEQGLTRGAENPSRVLESDDPSKASGSNDKPNSIIQTGGGTTTLQGG
jgi:hypothetical protein